MKDKKILIFGAAGTIGSALCDHFSQKGYYVIASVKNDQESPASADQTLYANVLGRFTLDSLAKDLGPKSIDHVVYSVGHCPPGGFEKEISQDILAVGIERLRRDLSLHVEGTLNVAQCTFPLLRDGESFTVIGSAIIGLPVALAKFFKLNEFLHAGTYAAAKAGQQQIVKYLRLLKQNIDSGITSNYLGFSAVRGSFHTGPKKILPPAMFEVEHVCKIVEDTILSGKNKSKNYSFLWLMLHKKTHGIFTS